MSTTNPTVIAADDRNGLNDVRRPAYLSGNYAAKCPPAIEPLTLRVRQDPLRPSASEVLMIMDHAPFSMGAEAAAMVYNH